MGHMTKVFTGLMLSACLAGSATASMVLAGSGPAAVLGGTQSDQTTPPATQSFTAPAGVVVEAIRWWGYHGSGSGGSSFDNFLVQLGGMTLSGALTVSPGTLFDEYTLDIADVDLTATTLSIVNDDENVEWFWQGIVAMGDPGAASETDFAFELLGRQGTTGGGGGTVDAPATPALVLAGLAGLFWSRRRRVVGAADARIGASARG